VKSPHAEPTERWKRRHTPQNRPAPKRRSWTEAAAATLGVLLMGVGFASILSPTEVVFFHPAGDEWGWPTGYLEKASRGTVRAYGILASMVGAGLIVIVFLPKRRP
jgi:hypothetical protein